MRRHFRLAEIILYLSFIIIFAFLILARPPLSFLVLLLAPIALAAVLSDFVGGTLAALVAMIGVALLLALDPDAYRRAHMLQEVWPILVAYLVAGLFVGWLVSRERESQQQLAETAYRLQSVQEIVQVINTLLDPQDTLQAIIAETGRLIPSERAAVLLRSGDHLRVMATDETEPESTELLYRAFTLQEAAAGKAVLQGRIWSGGPIETVKYPDAHFLCFQGGAQAGFEGDLTSDS